MVNAGPDDERPGIVHRLDKGTSGLLVVARSAAAREGLVRQMANRSTDRRYLALVHGQVEGDEGIIEAPLGRSPSQRVKMAVVQGGRSARTHTRPASAPLAAPRDPCHLPAGDGPPSIRVRVHFAAIGHPVVGDERYSKPSLFALALRNAPGPGPALVARRSTRVRPPAYRRAPQLFFPVAAGIVGGVGDAGLRHCRPGSGG